MPNKLINFQTTFKWKAFLNVEKYYINTRRKSKGKLYLRADCSVVHTTDANDWDFCSPDAKTDG